MAVMDCAGASLGVIRISTVGRTKRPQKGAVVAEVLHEDGTKVGLRLAPKNLAILCANFEGCRG